MNKERWKEIEKIYFAAATLKPDEQEQYLRSASGDDDRLYAELKMLLNESRNPSLNMGATMFDLGMKVLKEQAIVEKRVGTTLGRYRLLRTLGTGGMGVVYEAEDLDGNRKVAVKVINEEFAVDPERIRRFRREETAVSMISHPNVARVFGLQEGAGETFIVMEFVDGRNLRQIIEAGISPAVAIDIAVQITSAVVSAHRAGVVHRDIKPENIIVTPEGAAKVLDFGLAKLVEPISQVPAAETNETAASATGGMSTEHGLLIGTPAYMSPEQLRAQGIDRRTDIWSIGVLFYEMLSGKLPFTGPTKIDSIAAILLSDPPSLQLEDRIQEKANSIIRTALTKDKNLRYGSAEELLSDLLLLKELYLPATRGSGQRSWTVPIAIAAVAAVILLLVFVFFPRSDVTMLDRPKISAAALPITDGLVSYWPADGNTNDLTGTNPGELLNGATYRPGVSGEAFSFDGVDDVFQAGTNGLALGTGARTIVSWIYVDEFVAEEAIAAGYGEPHNTKAFVLGTTDQHPYASNFGASIAAEKIKPGRWYQLAVSVAPEAGGTNLNSLYIDGECTGTSALRLDTQPGAHFYSGRIPFGRDDENRRLRGAIDEISVYDRALSAEEIRTLFTTLHSNEK